MIKPLARRGLYAINRLFARCYHDLHVLSPCPLPRSGPAIVICNHTSGLDPYLIQSVSPRMIRWMMAREYYEIPALRWMFETIDAIPVNRTGQDVAATRAALRTLSQGQILGIFPEGRIETDRKLLPFHTGAAMLATRKQVSVYPVWIDGTQRNCAMSQAFARRQRAFVKFGPPIASKGRDNRTQLEELTHRYEQAIGELTISRFATVEGAQT